MYLFIKLWLLQCCINSLIYLYTITFQKMEIKIMKFTRAKIAFRRNDITVQIKTLHEVNQSTDPKIAATIDQIIDVQHQDRGVIGIDLVHQEIDQDLHAVMFVTGK